MNKIILMGRLTRDPETTYSQSSKTAMAISKFSIAVDRKFKRQGEVETDFFNCVAFGKQGEFVEKYLSKGNKILLTGRIENNNYTNREGQKVYSVQVSVEEVEFAESKQQNSGNANIPKQDADGFMNIPQGLEEELPFA
jgi:single-strand DNA-binding protein